jgi:hypothetical protein
VGGNRDGALVLHETVVGRGHGVGTDVVGIHPRQAVGSEGSHVAARNGGDGHVARLGQEHRTHAHRVVLEASLSVGEVSEGVGEAGPGVDLEQELGELGGVEQRCQLSLEPRG